MERERKTAIYADLEDLSGALQRAKEQSLDTMEQENILARALELYKEGNLELAREKINIVLKSLDKLYEQDALSAIREAEKAVDIARKNKIGTREAEELLKNAKSFFDNADYMSAKRLADQVTTQTKKEIGKKAMATERQRLKELGRKNLAVSNFEGRPPISSSEAAFITDFFRQAFIKAGTFNVLDRSNMEQILAEQGFQQTGCTTEECAVQMGKFLNVHLMVVGSCGKLLSRFIITVNIVDIESGKFIYSDKESCYSEEEIEGMVDKIVGRISTEFQ